MRRIIIGALTAVAVFVLADFSAAAYCEYRLSSHLREHNNLGSDPEVTLQAVPFGLAAIRGEVPKIDIRARGVHSDEMRNTAAEAQLRGVQISGRQLFAGDYDDVAVESILGSMRIDVTELGLSIGIPDLELVPPTEEREKADLEALPTTGGVIFSGTVPVGAEEVLVNVRADLVISAGALRIVAQELMIDPEEGLPAAITEADRPTIVSRFSTVVDRLVLPFDAVPRKVWAEGTQIVIEGTSTQVEVALDKLQMNQVW